MGELTFVVRGEMKIWWGDFSSWGNEKIFGYWGGTTPHPLSRESPGYYVAIFTTFCVRFSSKWKATNVFPKQFLKLKARIKNYLYNVL